MNQFRMAMWWAIVASGLGAAGVAIAAAPPAKTKVTYSEAYGKGGAQPEVTAKDLPRFPALEPAQALASFQVRKGFRLELVASEPLVNSPVTMAFDEHGRLFVVEMIDYSERRDETPHGGRIRLLEDTDGDGRFDKSTVFADNLPWPTAVICYGGGIFVGASPDIIWLKDTNGDGKADERNVVFTGFGSGVTRLNVQALINSFNWGLDNRIHGATGPNGGNAVRATATNAPPALDLRGKDFSFEPRSLRIQPETGGGQYGLSFDSVGRKFVCSNSDHLQMLMYELRHGIRNPQLAMPGPRISIAADGPAAEVFRISPDEPWRIIRTRWRVSGVVPGMVEGGGRVSGYFTGATGATIYRGDAYGLEFVDNAFIGDAGGNLVHRKVLVPNGVALTGKRPADEQNSEFIASRDTWFRPVHFQNGPDGCLYIADMYREVIEHPWSIPEAIKKHIDLNSGNDRGRIYRVVPEGFKQPARPQLATATTSLLVANLASPNGWTRDTAARLLYERQDRRAVPELEKLLRSRSMHGRLHALYTLQGLISLESRHVLAALGDPEERVREHAVKLAEPLLSNSRTGGGALVDKLLAMTGDLSPRVRYQLAFTLGEVRHANQPRALAEIIRRDVDIAWTQWAVLSALNNGLGEVFTTLIHDRHFRSSVASAEFLRKLVELIGARNNAAEIRSVLEFAIKPDPAAPVAVLVRALGDGAARAGTTLAAVDKLSHLKGIFAAAAQTAENPKASEAARIQAVQLLAMTSFAESGTKLARLLDAPQDPVRLAAMGALARFSSPEVGSEILKRWADFSPRVRTEALAVLLTRADRSLAVLQAVQAGTIKTADISAAQVKALRASRDPAVSALAAKVFVPEAKAAEVLKTFQPALAMAGDAQRGKTVFLERCVACHRAGQDGFALGPDFVTVKTAGKDKLLASIIDPNAEVAPQFIAFQVDTRDDESYTAIIGNETPGNVTLRMANGQEVNLPRTKVKAMKSSGQSLMPEGLANGLTPQSMADLIEFIMTAEARK
jgi:putative membrane-bound dehydrogenase-like protein